MLQPLFSLLPSAGFASLLILSDLSLSAPARNVLRVLLSVQFSRNDWWAEVDSNHRPHAYQACALTN